MKLSTPLIVLLLTVNAAEASSLDVYQDRTFYHYLATDNFIGFSQRVQARCEGSPMALTVMSDCPENERLCKVKKTLNTIEYKLENSTAIAKVLEKLIALPKPSTLDATASITAAKEIGKEQAKLLRRQKRLQNELAIKQKDFRKQAPAQQATRSSTLCQKEVELTIPYGFVSFYTRYEADITNKNEISVTQYLSVVNRSGIDIEAETAMFYYRTASQRLYPTHFSPWIVRKYTPKKLRKMYKSKKVRKNSEEMAVPMMSIQADTLSSAPIASYEDAREYKIKNLILPSSGIALDFPILTWKSKLSCELRTYPYTNTTAFHVCSFIPKYQIDKNTWKVTSGAKVINDNASGEYRDEKYDIYTKVEEEIKIVRKNIVQRERETGIFGGTARNKDGFRLTLTNKSDKVKTLTVVERIPTSMTEAIKVKLLEIKSDKKIDYALLKDGKIEMKISLAANETKKIEVLFEISYDKDLKVDY